MAYEPKTWETGEVITATDLNHMENGIGAFYVTSTTAENVTTLSASYNDLLAAYNAGKTIVYVVEQESSGAHFFYYLFTMNYHEVMGCGAIFGADTTTLAFSASDANTHLTRRVS